MASVPSSQAVTINVTYDLINSTPHTLDPLGTQLFTIVDVAAGMWEDIILDPWTLNITISWTNLSDANGTLGLHQNTGTVIGRPTNATIGFDNLINGVDRNWYFDTFPFDHAEYNLQQTVFSTNPTGFSGNTPNVLEVGYQGTFVASAPPAAQTGSDLLSVALHEIGHALGMTQNVATSETGDGDYDVDANLVGGSNIAIADDGSFHLTAPLALMFPSINTGTRILPSATDVLAVAASPDPSNVEWVDIHLPRRNFLGGADLNNGFDWVGGLAPDATTDAWVRQNLASPPFTTATANLDARNLTVQDGSIVNTAGFRIRSVFDTTITGTDSQIRIGLGGKLEADDVFVTNGGRLRLFDDSGLLQINVDLQGNLDVDNLSVVEGYGNVFFDDFFENDGTIRATGGNLLWFITTAGDYDLDGAQNTGIIDATEGDVTFSGTMGQSFGSDMSIGPGHAVTFTFPWTLGTFGEINMAGTSTPLEPAKIAGQQARFFGDIVVSSRAEIQADAIFEFFSQGILNNASDHLTLRGNTILRGAQFTGQGTLMQLADITVEEDTAIDAAVYDWGNSLSGMVHQTIVQPNVTYTINSPSTGTASNEYRGTIQLNNGVLDVRTASAWTLPAGGGAGDTVPGILILNANNELRPRPTLLGSDLILGGLLQAIGGHGQVSADMVARPSAEIDVQTGAELTLDGHVTYDGPLVHGDGILYQNADADVVSSTTIATNTYDWDGEFNTPPDMNIAPGAVLTINSSAIDVSPIATDGYDGHVTVADTAALIVNTSGPWRLDGTVTLEGQPVISPSVILDGSDLVNYGTIEGNGQVQLSIENHGTLSPGLSAGLLQFQAGFDLMPDSIVDIELGGLNAIAEYDQIRINPFGTANLSGDLEVSLINGFVPQPGDEFTILTAGVVSGKFDHEIGVGLPPGLDFEVNYKPNAVELFFLSAFTADFDMDGDVDGDDLTQWEGDYGVNGNSDANGDGDSDGDDFLAWQQQFGSGLMAVSAAGTVVPEPGSLALVLSAIAGTATLSRQRRRGGDL